MSTGKILFSDPEMVARIKSTITALQLSQTDSDSLQMMARQLATVLEIVLPEAKSFDEKCQYNIEHVGNAFAQAIAERGTAKRLDVVRLSVLMLRFILEYDISTSGTLSPDLQNFVDSVEEHVENFSPDMKGQLDEAATRQEYEPGQAIGVIDSECDLAPFRRGFESNTSNEVTSQWKHIPPLNSNAITSATCNI